MSGWQSTKLFDPFSLPLSPLVTPPLERKRETSFTGRSVISVVTNNVELCMSADQYIGLSITRHFVLLVSTHSSPPPLSPFWTTSSSSSLSSFLHFPFPSPSSTLSSVYPLWRGPVMSAPSDKPSLSLPLFCTTRGSRKGGLALCSAVQQTGASQAGRSEAQRGIWCGCLSGASGGAWEDTRWPGLRGSGGATSKVPGPLEPEWCGEA